MSHRLPLPGIATSVVLGSAPEASVRGVTISCDVVGPVVDFAGALEPQPSNVISVMDLHIAAEDTEGLRPNVLEAARERFAAKRHA
jgi:hypothetical protein